MAKLEMTKRPFSLLTFKQRIALMQQRASVKTLQANKRRQKNQRRKMAVNALWQMSVQA
jgi:hypothetical protein